MRSRIVSVFSDALASAKVPVLDVAARYQEVGEARLPLINPIIQAKYGVEIASFIVENVSVPPEVEQAIDKRSSMAAVGNLNDYVKFQMAQQIMQQQAKPQWTAPSGAASASVAAGRRRNRRSSVLLRAACRHHYCGTSSRPRQRRSGQFSVCGRSIFRRFAHRQ